MTTYSYIFKQNYGTQYFTIEYQLLEVNGYYVGTTYEDYLNGAYVELTDEQAEFHKKYPTATIEQVLNLEVPEEPKRTIEEAKSEMLRQITYYDNSTMVNGFTINGSITAWFTPTERNNYSQSVSAAKLMGIDTLSFFVNNTELTVSTANAEMMLAAIQLYADKCYIVTMQHKLAVNALETIEEVDNYNYRQGYPERLNFDLA